MSAFKGLINAVIIEVIGTVILFVAYHVINHMIF